MNIMVTELEKMADFERNKLYQLAKRLVPHLAPEDILQPQDFPELEQNPEFRYQEGVVIGVETALAALRIICCSKQQFTV